MRNCAKYTLGEKMKIADYETKLNVASSSELDSALSKRYRGGVNEFWIFPDDQEFPSMSILVNGNLACVQYFPNKDHPGFISNVAGSHLVDGEDAIFFVNTPTEEIEICAYQVVDLKDALNAAKEFFDSGKLPQAILWEEL